MTTTTVIFLVCQPCDDSYYQGHPFFKYNPTEKKHDDPVAFTTREAAVAYCAAHNGTDVIDYDNDDDAAHEGALYITEVVVHS